MNPGLKDLVPEVLNHSMPHANAFAALRAENHTLKRCFTDPHIFSGIGNAYSDEILHRAQLSPVAMTQKLSDEESRGSMRRPGLYLSNGPIRLRAEAGDKFPEGVTAFRPEMAVHGRYRRAVSALRRENPAHPLREQRDQLLRKCQTGGRLLADRALSRLMHQDWPRTLEELEDLKKRRAKEVRLLGCLGFLGLLQLRNRSRVDHEGANRGRLFLVDVLCERDHPLILAPRPEPSRPIRRRQAACCSGGRG